MWLPVGRAERTEHRTHAAHHQEPPARGKGFLMVEVRGFEPLASSVRGKRSAGLSYTPRERRQCTAGRARQEPARSLRSRSWITVVVRSDLLRSISALATSVVRRRPPVMPSG